MDESDFETIPTPAIPAAVAIDNKHAYKKVVINPLIPDEPSPIKKEDVKKVVVSDKVSENVSEKVVSKKKRDRINSLEQKEGRLEEAGVSRLKYMKRIAEALDAEVEISEWVKDEDDVRVLKKRMVPDWNLRKWGVEQAAKLYGDMIERKEVEYDVGDRTLDKFKKLSVSDMKARMADLLLGKPVARLSDVEDAEVIKRMN